MPTEIREAIMRVLSQHSTLALIGVVCLAACQSTGRLAEYEFAGGTLATVYEFPPYPEVFTGPYFPGHPEDPVHSLFRLGTRIAKEVAAADIRDRLDSAAAMVDVAGRLSERTSVRAARFLRVELIDDEASADFGLEVRVRDYGIDANEWDAAAHFFVDAQVVLYDGFDGSEIWESEVRERDPIMPHIFGHGPARAVRDVVTAAALASMSEENIARALEHLADYASDRISETLRNSLEKARDEQR